MTQVDVPRRELGELHPDLVVPVLTVLHECARRKLAVYVAEAWRHPDRQWWLYGHGRPDLTRMWPDEWRALPRADGRPGPIEAPPVVTRARPGTSYHNLQVDGLACAAAVDVAVWDEDVGPWPKRLEWDASQVEWRLIHEAAHKAGLVTLSWEAPHLQLPGKLADLMERARRAR